MDSLEPVQYFQSRCFAAINSRLALKKFSHQDDGNLEAVAQKLEKNSTKNDVTIRMTFPDYENQRVSLEQQSILIEDIV